MTEFQEIFDEAERCFEEDRFLETEILYQQLIDRVPSGCADIHNKLGIMRHVAGDFGEAISQFSTALEINPYYTEAALNLTIAYTETKQYDKAQEVMAKAGEHVEDNGRKMDPFVSGKLANEHYKLGNTYFDLGLLDEAETQYRTALSLRPNLMDVMMRLGMTLRERGYYTEAINWLRKAKELRPRHVPVILQLGVTYYANGFLDLASAEWDAAKEIEPEGKAVQMYLALARKDVISTEDNLSEEDKGREVERQAAP